MPLVKSADVFIERSLHLLETNPASTRISITYGSESKRQSKKKQHKITKPETTSSSENKSFVSFKTYDPISGQLHKLKTHKTKELSKLLTALGPHGVSIPKPIKNVDETQQKETIEQVPIKGFSTILTNTEIQEELTPEPERPKSSDQQSNNSASASTTTGGGSKKNKKKKGKR